MLGGLDSPFRAGGFEALIIRLGAVEYVSTLPVLAAFDKFYASEFFVLSRPNFPDVSVGGVSFFRRRNMFGVSRCGLNVASNSAKLVV